MRSLALLGAVAVALALAADAGAVSRREWARSANSVCVRELARSHAVVRALEKNPPASVRRWVVQFDHLIASFRRMHRDLSAIRRPARDKRRIRTMLASLRKSTRELQFVRRAELAHDLPNYRRHIARARHYAQRADALAVALGANACGRG